MNYLDRSNRKLNAIEARIRLLIKRAQLRDLDELLNMLATRLEQHRWRITDFIRALKDTGAISEDDAQRLLNHLRQRFYVTAPVNREVIDFIINFVQNQPRDRRWAFIDGMEKLMSRLPGMPQEEQADVSDIIRQGIGLRQPYQQSPLYQPDQPQIGEPLTMIPLGPNRWLFLGQNRYAAWIGDQNKYLTPVDHQYVVELLKQQPNLRKQAKNVILTSRSSYYPVYFFREPTTGTSFSIPSEEQIRQYLPDYTPQQLTQQNMQPFAPRPTQQNTQPFTPRPTQQNMQPFAPETTQPPIPGRTQRQPNAGKRGAPSY